MMKFSCGFSTFSFIFDFRNGLYWVANVFILEIKYMCILYWGVFLKSEISHFMIQFVTGFL